MTNHMIGFLFHVLADLLPSHQSLNNKVTSNCFFHYAELHCDKKERAVAAGCLEHGISKLHCLDINRS